VESTDRVRPVVLVADDEPAICEAFEALLAKDYEVLTAQDGEQVLGLLRHRAVSLVILDILMPRMDGIEVLRRIRESDQAVDVIVVTAVSSLKIAVEAIRLGAFDYVTKPFDTHEIRTLIQRALERQSLNRELLFFRAQEEQRRAYDSIIGESERMRAIFDLIPRVADTNVTVLVTGESGTGKELLAHEIHAAGPRAGKPFVAINCAAIPGELLESELFGHERGAFTGATGLKVGKFELANGGTLFLDEVGALRLDLQAKLLRAIQQREIERVGGMKLIKVDVRIIAATNQDLRQAVEAGRFREDLYYRLNVVPVVMPPLRHRKDDIPILVQHFIEKCNREFNRQVKRLSPGAMAALLHYDWPGNVRELQNVIERVVALAQGEMVGLKELPLDIGIVRNQLFTEIRGDGLTLREARARFEAQYILRVLEKVGWSQTEAAKLLGVHRNTLFWKIQQLGLRDRIDSHAWLSIEPSPGPSPGDEALEDVDY
jgi:DNA-binding NtrC family response regulator